VHHVIVTGKHRFVFDVDLLNCRPDLRKWRGDHPDQDPETTQHEGEDDFLFVAVPEFKQ